MTGRRSRLAVIAAAVLGVAIVVVVGAAVLSRVAPAVSASRAEAIARVQLAGMTPKATAMVLVSARFNPTPDRVYDDQGNLIYSESRSVCEIRPIPMALPAFLCHASPAWVIHLRNAQGQDGYVLVDSGSGRVGWASVNGPG